MILNKRKFIISILCVLVWMGMIFSFSAQPSEQSDEVSLGFGRVIAERFVPNFEERTPEEQLELVESWNHVIRKTAHFTEYAVLGVLYLLTLCQLRISSGCACVAGIIVSALYAASDEFHQYFVPGRAGRISDVCIDTAGAVTGIILLMVIWRMWKNIQNIEKV